MITLTLEQISNDPSLLVDRLGNEEMLVTRNGQPLARVASLVNTKRHLEFGCAKGQIKFADDFDTPVVDL